MLTKEITDECRSRILLYVDGLTRESLVRDDIPLNTSLGDLGIGPQKCKILENKVQAEQRARGKAETPDGTITVSTTVGR